MVEKTIAHYEVLDEIGAGGMGVVYRARDTRLDRMVAIKALPEELAEDPERLARFEREAKLLASLKNPYIATVYGLEEVEGRRFLAMELVEGKTLAVRLSKNPIPVREALELARQIAEALEAAHEADIIHRDVKPGNIMIGKDGKAKVLDFGLAKALRTDVKEVDPSLSPTLTQPMTQAGHILGTPVYMSPEQAEGKEAGKQSDIWAFGCVLYEMLTGKRAFAGPIVGDAEVEPDWKALPARTPVLVRSLIRRCLRKDLHRRLHDIADARLEIEEAAAELVRGGPGEEEAAAVAPLSTRATWWMLLAAAAIGALASWIAWRSFAVSPTEPQSAVRFDLRTPPGVSLHAGLHGPVVSLSPDGRWLVFVGEEGGTRRLFKRSLERSEISAMPGTQNARFAFFSPDSSQVGFWDSVAGEIKKVPLVGGRAVTLCKAPNAWGGTWGSNGQIVFSPGDATGLWQVSEAGGEPRQLLAPSPEQGVASYLLPEFLPDGRSLLYTAWTGGFTLATGHVGVLDLASGKTGVLLENAAGARYLPSGHLIFGRGGRTEVAPFDLRSRKVTGPSVPVPEPIFYNPGGVLHLAVSDTGRVAFVPGDRAPRRRLVYVDAEGNRQPVAGQPRGYEYARFSGDGKRLAAAISELGEPSIWTLDGAAGLLTRLAGEGRRSLPLWSPDSSSISFAVETTEPSASWSIFHQQADASSPPEPLLLAQEAGERLWPLAWTPDEEVLVLGRWLASSSKDIYYLARDGNGEPQPFLASEADEIHGVLSPDGRWMAYASNETGNWAIYVQKFPQGGERHQISAGDAEDLAGWAPESRAIYYVAGNRMMEVPITTSPKFSAEAPRALFELTYSFGPWWAPDVHLSPDGRRFLIVEPDESWDVATEITIALNWLDEVQELASP